MRNLFAIVFSPIAGILIFTLFERGSFLLQSFNSGSDIIFVSKSLMLGMLQLVPAYVLMLLISLPVIYLTRRAIGVSFIACLIVASFTVCLLSLLFWFQVDEDLRSTYSSITIIALLLSAILYGAVMWLIVDKHQKATSSNG